MGTKISSREVLAYLNELGYKNVNAQQLKEFIQDLKKLIKHEERRRSEEQISASPFTETSSKSQNKTLEAYDIFSVLHSQGTVASNARAVPKKESVISVQIKRNRSKPQIPCTEHNKENHVIKEDGSGEAKCMNTADLDTEPVKLSNVSECGDGKKVGTKKSNMLKAKSSFIRPTIHMNCKSDPVALYHHYQALWKRQKIPGQDNRTDLRWAIREKMSRAPRYY